MEQADIAFREASRFGTRDHEYADRISVAHHRHEKSAAQANSAREVFVRVIRIEIDIRNMHDCTLENGARRTVQPAWSRRVNAPHFGECLGSEIVLSDLVYPFAIVPKQCTEESAAKPDHARYYRVEYRLHIGRRARDYSQNFTGCSLLLERLDEIALTLFKARLERRQSPGQRAVLGARTRVAACANAGELTCGCQCFAARNLLLDATELLYSLKRGQSFAGHITLTGRAASGLEPGDVEDCNRVGNTLQRYCSERR